jgi:hypothetical protein
VGVVPSRGLTPKTLIWPFVPEVAPEKLIVMSKCPKSGFDADAVVVARPSSVPAASRTTATTVPLSTLAVPEIATGELIALLPSGLSMMIFRLLRMGVAAVVGSDELAGEALAPVDGEALPDAELAAGDPLCSTKVVVLSPPQAAMVVRHAPASSNRSTLFIEPLLGRVKPTPSA